MSLIDTPLRTSLTSQSTQIRADLKAFERDFFATHGRKPGKDDIRQNPKAAAKYKEYNRVRDVLSGKLPALSLQASSPSQERKRKRSRHDEGKDEGLEMQTPRKLKMLSTPRKALGMLQPHELDPYDAPSSASPRPPITALGPTPQRDGRVMGIFDLLEASGGKIGSSGKKRRLSILFDNDVVTQSPEGRPKTADRDQPLENLQTPARNRTKQPDDVLDHLTGTPTTSRHHGRARTPASSAKKFRLSQFFATPSAERYASMLQDTDPDNSPRARIGATPDAQRRQSQEQGTPLLDRVLGRTPTKRTPTADAHSQHGNTQGEAEGEKTPAYLKRSYSFKQRLLSASTTHSANHSRHNSLDGAAGEPPAVQRLPPGRRRTRFNPRPLSQIAKEMQQREVEKERAMQAAAVDSRDGRERNQSDAEDGWDDDEMEALREIEVNDDRTLLEDSQLADAEQAARSVTQLATTKWKKKGQKRSTRRVIMRPSKIKIQDPDPKRRAATPESGGDQDPDIDSDGEADASGARIADTQLHHPIDGFSDDELLAQAFADSDEELFGASSSAAAAAAAAAKTNKGNSSRNYAKDKLFGKPSKTSKRAAAGKETSWNRGGEESDSDDGEPMRKINPNAQSHMNFKTLKIKNKNSKAKGRGRFGGRGRGRR
ncbi:uncharacterized protein HMPREF1541_03429 [Cyphellophora europaea CBS 101466]|uniref:DNA replication regulator SLD2 n=1 Tax=Cyphellophora europaea (strain CBS 101466) TaxID=1220924 RepID=W2S0D6_CYPE1|nr:uncharacterized protein HMPREF1541_03429 [Cyphellophora europaea CBS 101466]ETN41493.1 hypothetical protein HMPREF1541_03429 [Cyphellophora europaea CBS 101466]